MAPHRAEILRGLTICWRHIRHIRQEEEEEEEADEEAVDHHASPELQALEQTLKDDLRLLYAATRATTTTTTKDDDDDEMVVVDLNAEINRLVESDHSLGLFFECLKE